MQELEAALLANEPEVRRALAAAEQELAETELKIAELRAVITRAKALLGVPATDERSHPPPMSLHDAMQVVLRETHEPLSVRELTERINARGLYRRRDGRPVDVGQIHARAGSYSSLFQRLDGRIALRQDDSA